MTARNTIKDLAIFEIEVDKLKAYGKNPRIGNVEAIAESLEANGQYRPIVVRRETGEILAGNHTWKAAKYLDWPTIKVTYVENISDEAAARIVLADNRYSEMGTYDDKALTDLLGSIQDLTGTGYSSEDLEQLIDDLAPEKDIAKTDPDHVPEIPTEKDTVSKPGDVWKLGKHRLICGDATKAEDFEKLMAGAQADLVVTDPPYNVAYQGGTKDALKIENDAMSDGAFETFLTAAFEQMYEATKPGGVFYVFHGEGDGKGNIFRTTMMDTGWLLKQVLIWIKDRLVLSRQDHHWQHEPILYGWKPGAGHYWYGPRTDTTLIDEQPKFADMKREDLIEHIAAIYEASTIIREPRPSRNGQHPTMKPVNLVARLIDHSSSNGQLVLDPFGGSGSTLIAAHSTGRRAYLMELDPKYVDVICRRYQEHTGIMPILEATGEQHDFEEVEEGR